MTSTGTRTHTGPTAGHKHGDRPDRQEQSPEQTRDDLIELAAAVAGDLADLVRLYYRYIPPEEVVDHEPADLVGMVRAHRRLAETRVPGSPSVQVFNPDTAEGWSTAGTVV